jgi:hypothetical protein
MTFCPYNLNPSFMSGKMADMKSPVPAYPAAADHTLGDPGRTEALTDAELGDRYRSERMDFLLHLLVFLKCDLQCTPAAQEATTYPLGDMAFSGSLVQL